MFGVRARVGALLDILTVLGRSDLKKDIVKDLADQQAILKRLANRPGVDNARLQAVLREIDSALNNLQQLATQFASSALRDNEFLQSIMNRSTIPGGTCAFDLPAFHYWLAQSPEAISRDVDAWFADLVPFAQAILLDLRILRGIVPAQQEVARGGTYIHAPQTQCTLLRVFVPREAGVHPEISAGSHRFTMRFMELRDINQRATQTRRDVPFRLQCCAI